MPGFVAQVGDPQTKTNHGDFEGLGSGGPGYHFEIEFPPEGTAYTKYTVAMGNRMQYDLQTGEITGPTDSNGSQFFVMLDDAPGLWPYYSLLGEVAERHRGGGCHRPGAHQRRPAEPPAGPGHHRRDRAASVRRKPPDLSVNARSSIAALKCEGFLVPDR